MKNYFKYISLCLILFLGFTSCDLDDETAMRDTVDLGGYAHLVTNRLSQFDTNSTMSVNLFTAEGVTIESLEIVRDGAVIGTANVSGETATFNSSILGERVAGAAPIRLRATLSNGNVAEQPFNVTTVNALTLPTTNPQQATLAGLDTTAVGYTIFTHSATVDDVNLRLRRNAAGTFIDSGVDLEGSSGSVILGDTNYQQLNLGVNDTLYYNFTAASGTMNQSSQGFIVITEEP